LANYVLVKWFLCQIKSKMIRIVFKTLFDLLEIGLMLRVKLKLLKVVFKAKLVSDTSLLFLQ